MSAFLVDPEHINVLVHAATAFRSGDTMSWCVPDDSEIYGYRYVRADTESPDRIGQMLLDQNAASVNHRYDEDESYIYAYSTPKQRDWLPVDILGAISCYEYQACETPNWRDTEAHAFCEALRGRMIRRLPGYDSAPWEITPNKMPAHVEKARKAHAVRQAETQRVQAERIAAADAALAAGATELPGERSATVLTFPTVTAVAEQPKPSTAVDRDTAIKAIRTALRKRSGKAWSVRGGRGTAWGWITISAPPARSGDFGGMSDEDAAELGQLLGLDGSAHFQGVSIAAGSDYRREYIARAEGREPDEIGTPYWD